MNDDFNTIEMKARHSLDSLKLSTSPRLDREILKYSAAALNNCKNLTDNNEVLFEGYFLPKVAGEMKANFGMELIDSNDCLKLYLLEPNDDFSPFLLEMKSIQGNIDFFEKFSENRIIVKINDINVVETLLTMDGLREFIPRYLIPEGIPSWSYHVFSE